MNPNPRISSILNASQLDESITGLPSFQLSNLDIKSDIEFELPTNLRLGHLAERVVSELIKSSDNFEVLYENVQLIEDKRTIGELDFIVKEKETGQEIHMELAYKFYLYDPTISLDPINNWIGPNRNDSLIQKLEKTKGQQFPLLYHDCAVSELKDINVHEVVQSLCLLVSLFIPYEYSGSFHPVYESAIKGYYVSYKDFIKMSHEECLYHMSTKTQWGIDPLENTIWSDIDVIQETLEERYKEKQASLCWKKQGVTFSSFFIVWW